MKWLVVIGVLGVVACQYSSPPSSSVNIHIGEEESFWDTYTARYNAGVATTTLDMELFITAPRSSLPYLVMTGVIFDSCSSNGLPIKGEFSNLFDISDSLESIIISLTSYCTAGTFTHDCQFTNYYYVQDTIGVRTKLKKMYERQFKSYSPSIQIQQDSVWGAYLEFLYPNEEIKEYMSNEKLLFALKDAGVDLTKPRQLNHWIYFLTETGRSAFIEYANQYSFIIEKTETVDDTVHPYSLQISRVDSVDLLSINTLTWELHTKAKELNGEYDGWETFVSTN